MSHQEFDNISFDLPKNQSNVIKVVGVGGGGSNAINHMFSQGIKGVDFVICNTDAQALENSGATLCRHQNSLLTNRLTWALAGPRVCLSTLSTNWQTATMTNTTETTEIHQTLNIH